VKNKTLSICDFILANNFDICAITETWLGGSNDKTCISELVPNGYRINQVPPSGKRAGGVAIIHKASIQVKVVASSKDNEFQHFDYMDCNVTIGGHSIRVAIVYRPPPSKDNGLNTNFFLEHEWPIFLAKYATVDKNTIILGDLNFHLDLPDNRETKKFNSCLDACGMRQLVSEPTHVAGHTLDVMIIRDNDNIVSNIEIQDPGLSDSFGKTSRDHLAVIFEAKANSVTYTLY
jgi:exonuclease III